MTAFIIRRTLHLLRQVEPRAVLSPSLAPSPLPSVLTRLTPFCTSIALNVKMIQIPEPLAIGVSLPTLSVPLTMKATEEKPLEEVPGSNCCVVNVDDLKADVENVKSHDRNEVGVKMLDDEVERRTSCSDVIVILLDVLVILLFIALVTTKLAQLMGFT